MRLLHWLAGRRRPEPPPLCLEVTGQQWRVMAGDYCIALGDLEVGGNILRMRVSDLAAILSGKYHRIALPEVANGTAVRRRSVR